MSRFLEMLLLAVLVACSQAKTDKDDDRSADANPDTSTETGTAPGTETETGTGTTTDTNTDTTPPELRGVLSSGGIYRVDVEWIDGPDFENENNQLRLVFFSPDGKPATASNVLEFYPWMTSMGHGAPTIDLEVVADGSRTDAFLVTGLMLTMGGDWDLKIDATVDGKRAKASFPIEVPK